MFSQIFVNWGHHKLFWVFFFGKDTFKKQIKKHQLRKILKSLNPQCHHFQKIPGPETPGGFRLKISTWIGLCGGLIRRTPKKKDFHWLHCTEVFPHTILTCFLCVVQKSFSKMQHGKTFLRTFFIVNIEYIYTHIHIYIHIWSYFLGMWAHFLRQNRYVLLDSFIKLI